MNLSKSRTIMLMGSLGIVLILIASWFLLLSPRLATASDLNTQREGVEAQNVAAESNIAELEQMKENIGAVKTEADALTKRFPPTAEESTLFELVKQAAAKAGIPERAVSDLTIAVPAIGAGDGSVTLPEAAPAAPAPTDSDDAADAYAAPADGTVPVAAPTSQLGNMALDVTVTGTKAQIIDFLAALEGMDRAYLVSAVSLGGEGEGAGSSATINGNMYLLPDLVDPTAPVQTPEELAASTFTDPEGVVWTLNEAGLWTSAGVDGAVVELAEGEVPEGYVAP